VSGLAVSLVTALCIKSTAKRLQCASHGRRPSN